MPPVDRIRPAAPAKIPARILETLRCVREGHWDEAARIFWKSKGGLGMESLLRNNPSHNLLYSTAPCGVLIKPFKLRELETAALRYGFNELWALLGAAETAGRKLDAACRHLTLALRRDPGLYHAYLMRAAARLLHHCARRTRRRLQLCLSDLNYFLRVVPRHADGLRLRAEVRVDLRDERGALRDLKMLLATDPQEEWACVEMAEILCDRGRFREAFRLIKRLESLHGHKGWYWALKGRALATTGRLPQGLQALEKAVSLTPRHPAILAWRGEARRMAGRYRESLQDLNAALARDPNFIYAYEWRARALMAMGRYRAALKDLHFAFRTDPRHSFAAAWRAEAYFKSGLFQRAAAGFDLVYPLSPRQTWNLSPGAVRGARRGDMFEKDLQEALQHHPNNPWVWAFAGRCHVIEGRPLLGLGHLSRALSLKKSFSYAFYWKKMAWLRLGRQEDVRQDQTLPVAAKVS